jgi:hypothetical protein
MATTVPTSPLSQALTRKRSNPFPTILLAFGILVALGFALVGYLESRRTEAVVVLTRDIPFGQQITSADLHVIELPLHRPVEVQGIADPASLIGQYTTRDLGANDIVQPTMVQSSPPDQPVYPNGQQLSTNMVPVPFETTTIGPISYRDRVNIGFNDPTGDPQVCDAAQRAAAGRTPTFVSAENSFAQPRAYACRLLSSVRVLYVDEEAGLAYLELTPYQSHTIWALQAAGLQLWGERYGSTSEPLDVLTRLDAGQINSSDLDAPVQP